MTPATIRLKAVVSAESSAGKPYEIWETSAGNKFGVWDVQLQHVFKSGDILDIEFEQKGDFRNVSSAVKSLKAFTDESPNQTKSIINAVPFSDWSKTAAGEYMTLYMELAAAAKLKGAELSSDELGRAASTLFIQHSRK